MNFNSFSKLSLLSFIGASLFVFGEYRSVEVENDSDHHMHIATNSADLKIDHNVPARTHSKISLEAKSTLKNSKLRFPEKALLKAIIKNSPKKIVLAIRAGAKVNGKIKGKKPLAWAVLFKHAAVAKYLVRYGATL